jgi:hypothetical protein
MEPQEPIAFYLCPICFFICETKQECLEHLLATGHRLFACKPGNQGDERRKPVNNRFGQYASRAPRWFLEALGWIAEENG